MHKSELFGLESGPWASLRQRRSLAWLAFFLSVVYVVTGCSGGGGGDDGLPTAPPPAPPPAAPPAAPPVPPPAPPPSSSGNAVVWSDDAMLIPISVSLNGGAAGTIATVAQNPACNVTGGITLTAPVGPNNVTATATSGRTWSIPVAFSEGECKSVPLTKANSVGGEVPTGKQSRVIVWTGSTGATPAEVSVGGKLRGRIAAIANSDDLCNQPISSFSGVVELTDTIESVRIVSVKGVNGTSLRTEVMFPTDGCTVLEFAPAINTAIPTLPAGSGSGRIFLPGVTDNSINCELANVCREASCVIVDGRRVAPSDSCLYGYAEGAELEVKAEAAAGSNFVRWYGSCTGTNPTCIVTVDTGTAITGMFVKAGNAQIAIAGSGSGTIDAVWTGGSTRCTLSFGYSMGSCHFTVPNGTAITFTRAANVSNFVLGTWAQACSGSTTPTTCSIIAEEFVGVSANFQAVRPDISISVSVNGSGSGALLLYWTAGVKRRVACQLNYDPNYPRLCNAVVPVDVPVELTVLTGGSTEFLGYSGVNSACGLATSCTFQSLYAFSGTVNFREVVPPPPPPPEGYGGGTFTGGTRTLLSGTRCVGLPNPGRETFLLNIIETIPGIHFGVRRSQSGNIVEAIFFNWYEQSAHFNFNFAAGRIPRSTVYRHSLGSKGKYFTGFGVLVGPGIAEICARVDGVRVGPSDSGPYK